jgi:hypothetical protein
MNSARAPTATAVKSPAVITGARLVQRRCACGAAKSALHDACAECGSRALQTKLSVGPASDPLELEADRVADQVTRHTASSEAGRTAGPGTVARRPGPAAQITSGITGSATHFPAPPSVEQVLSTSGSPLPGAVREDMEQSFGRDFSAVRIHTDASASASARHIGANAYTAGSHVVFAPGQYAPTSSGGRHLLAHELTHVVQQAGTGQPAARREVIQRDVSNYTLYASPATVLEAFWAQMFSDNFDGIANHLKRVFKARGKESLDFLSDLFDEAPRGWEDSIASSFTELLGESDLDMIASSEKGRYVLSQMYVAMVTDSQTKFESEQSTRILIAKMRQYAPEDFLRQAQYRGISEGKKIPTRIFPIRFMRVTGGDYATPLAELQPNGMVRISYPSNLNSTTKFSRELKTIGNFIGGDGDLISANEIVIIKDYESGGAEMVLPALAMVDYANRSVHSTIGKIVEVSIFAATLGVGTGAAAAGKVGAEQAAVRFTATAIWGARIAKATHVLDVAANVIGVAAFVIDENREWIIEKFGRAGEILVRVSDIANTAATIYGVGRLAQAGIGFVRNFRKAAGNVRSEAKGLTNAEASVIEEIDDKLAKLVTEMEEELAKKTKPTVPKEEPVGTPHADDVAGRPSKEPAKEPGKKHADEPAPAAQKPRLASDEEVIANSARTHGLAPKTLQKEVDDLALQMRDPDNIFIPEDKKFDVELGSEKSGEPHQFQRERADRTWCRYSDEACKLDFGKKANDTADEGLKKAKSKRSAPPNPTHKEPFDMKRIDAPLDPPPQMLGTSFSSVKLKPNQDALYIVRDSKGEVLKVGKTSDLGVKGRFSVYRRGGKIDGRTVEIEVYPLEIQPRPLTKSAKTAEYYEAKLRSAMEADGHKMPWDNTNQRRGHEGFGTPGEGVRVSQIPRDEMEALLRAFNGDLKKVGEQIGKHPRTVDLWAKSLGLRPADFKVKK